MLGLQELFLSVDKRGETRSWLDGGENKNREYYGQLFRSEMSGVFVCRRYGEDKMQELRQGFIPEGEAEMPRRYCGKMSALQEVKFYQINYNQKNHLMFLHFCGII